MDIKEFAAMIDDAVLLQDKYDKLASLSSNQTATLTDAKRQIDEQKNQIGTLAAQTQRAVEDKASLQTQYDGLRVVYDDLKPKYNRLSKFYTILADALKYMSFDVPYVFSAEYPKGMDCSSFMQQIFGENGITLPRASYQQINVGSSVKEADILPGDLIVFDRIGSDNKADHIGMYVGNGLMIHTAKPGENINVTNWKKRYGTSLADIRRVF